MPFDFKAYDAKCSGLTPEELQREWEHYTRLIAGASTSTAVSGIAVPFTLGVSTIGVAMAAPAIHNARKKRDIIEKHLNKHGATHVTRKRDVLGSMAVSGTIGVVTLGVGTAGADAIATAGAEHGISAVVENETAIKVVAHAAMDGVGMGIEHAHTSRLKKKDAFKAFRKAGVFQALKDAKAAEAGYSIQPYNPQTFASGGNTAQALPPPQPTYGGPMSPPPSYPASPGYAFPPGSKSPAHTMHAQVQNSAMPGSPSQYQTPLPQYNSSSTPYYETTVPAYVGHNQSQDPNSTAQPYSSYVAQPSQGVSTSSTGITQQHTSTQPSYSHSGAGGSITSPSHDAYDMGALAQALPTSTAVSVPTPAQEHSVSQVPQEGYPPHIHHAPSHLAHQSHWQTSGNQQPLTDMNSSNSLTPPSDHCHTFDGPQPTEVLPQHSGVRQPDYLTSGPPSTYQTTDHSQTAAHHDPTPQAGPPETKAPPSPPEPTMEELEQLLADPRLQQTMVRTSPPPAGSLVSHSTLKAQQPVVTYDPANHQQQQSYRPGITTQHQVQQQSQYTARHSCHQHPGHSSKSLQHNPQTQPLPPTSTYYPPPPSQVPPADSHQPPTPTTASMSTGTCLQPAPPTAHQAYRPTPWTVPPPPPYPPPVQNAAQAQQQQTAPGVQHAPSTGLYIQPAYQQISQTTIQQQQYQPVSHSYQPQYQAQQQVLQAYNPPPTPLSPPYGAQVAPQGGSGYFSAMATAQYQAISNAPKENGQPAVQGPYTPAATPAATPGTV